MPCSKTAELSNNIIQKGLVFDRRWSGSVVIWVPTADSDDPGQGFQLKADTIPIEGGQGRPVGSVMGSQRL